MPVDSDIARDTEIAELLRQSDAETMMAEQLRSQSRQQFGVAATFGKLQSAIQAHVARAAQLRAQAMAALAARGGR